MSFLRQLLGLGPSQEEAWRRLASELGAEFVRGGFWRGQGHRVTRTLEVGDPDFDRNFVIEGNDTSKVQALFARARIRQLIQQQPSLNLCVGKDEFFCQLYLEEPGVIKDVQRLKSLFGLFEETLSHLCRMSSVTEDDPNVGREAGLMDAD